MVGHPNRSKKTPSPARNPTPDEIRAARLAHGLTQAQAAEVLFSSLRAWEDWENGRRRMHPVFWIFFQQNAGG